MKNDIYLQNGYFNAEYIFQIPEPIIIIIGGRGTGKTYGILKELLNRSDCYNELFLHVRRTQTQLDIINKTEYSSYQEINSDTGDCVYPFSINKYVAGYHRAITNESGKLIPDPDGKLLGMTAALSTFSNLRSVSMSSIKTIFYDEFIPQVSEKIMKYEGQAVLNMYETVNRNRELQGENAVKMIMASNANTLYSDVLQSFGILNNVAKMLQTGKEVSRIKSKGIAIIQLFHSEISWLKSKTVLYKANTDEMFNEMSIHNRDIVLTSENICSMPIKEYKPLFAYGGISVYEHKSADKYYVTYHKEGGIDEVRSDIIGRQYINRIYRRVYHAYNCGRIAFESLESVHIFRSIWGV